MRIGSNEGVGEIDPVPLDHNSRQILEIDLVTNPDSGRHHTEAIERLHAPFEEFIASHVALELHFHVPAEGVRYTREIDLDRVIDHQVNWHQRPDQVGILCQPLYG